MPGSAIARRAAADVRVDAPDTDTRNFDNNNGKMAAPALVTALLASALAALAAAAGSWLLDPPPPKPVAIPAILAFAAATFAACLVIGA